MFPFKQNRNALVAKWRQERAERGHDRNEGKDINTSGSDAAAESERMTQAEEGECWGSASGW
jgi:hypothetical protein